VSESKRGNFSTIPFVGILTDEIRNSMDVVVCLCVLGGAGVVGGGVVGGVVNPSRVGIQG